MFLVAMASNMSVTDGVAAVALAIAVAVVVVVVAAAFSTPDFTGVFFAWACMNTLVFRGLCVLVADLRGQSRHTVGGRYQVGHVTEEPVPVTV